MSAAASHNPKREKMEELMKQGMSREEAYEQVFGVEPRKIGGNRPQKPGSADTDGETGTENLTEDEIKDIVTEDSTPDRFAGVTFASPEARALADENKKLMGGHFTAYEPSGANGDTKADVQAIIDELNKGEVIE